MTTVWSERSPLQSEGRARLLRNIGVLSGGQLVTWTLSLIWTLFVPRALGPAGMGLLVLNVSVGAVMTVLAGLGTRLLLVREIAADRQAAGRLLGSTFYLRSFVVLPALLLTLLYIRLGAFDHEHTLFLILAYAAAVINLFTEPFQAAFQGIERMGYLALGDVAVKTLGTAGAITLVLLGFKALALVILAMVLGWMILVLYLVLIRSYIRIDLRFHADTVLRLFKNSLSFWTFGAFYTIYLWIDSMLLAVLAPPEAVGWYGAPTRLFGTLMFVPTILCTAWLPRLVSAHRRSPDHLWAAARSPLMLILVLCLPVAVGAALIASPLITILYGTSFTPSIVVFIVLAFTTIPMYVNAVVNQILIACGRQMIWAGVMAGATPVNLLLNLGTIRYFQAHEHNGALGAAVALLVTEALIAGVGLSVIRPVFSWGLAVRLLKTLAATIGMAIPVWLAARFGLVAQVAIGVVAFAVLAAVLRIVSPQELRDLRALVRSRGRAQEPVQDTGLDG